MNACPDRIIDPELLALDSGLFDTLPPPKPLFGRAVDHHVLQLQSGLFDTLPPPPPLRAMYDSLAPVVEAELRGELPLPPPEHRSYLSMALGVGLALMTLCLGLRYREAPASAAHAAAPVPTQVIVLPEIVITADLPTKPAPAVAPDKRVKARRR